MRKRKHRNRRILIVIIVLLLAVLAAELIFIENLGGIMGNGSTKPPEGNAGSNSSQGNGQTSQMPPESSLQPGEDSEYIDPVQAEIDEMSLEEKVGQLVIVGIDGYQNDQHSIQFMEQYHVGGFIFFKRNIQDSAQMLGLINSLKETNAAAANIPLFLSIDEEGGKVSRLPEEFLKFPSNQIIGQRNDSDFSYKVGGILGKELHAFGLNVDFAPVLDINSNPKNPVIGDRSFGTTAEIAGKLGVATMNGIQSQNIISVVKHFPGHGDTSVDSHIGLPRVNHDMDRLESFELKPFAEAIENGAEVVMVAHILLPKLDAQNPASFSKTIISDVLRTQMNFNGVVITDDFTMGAIEENYNMGEAAVKSIQAGSDIVLVCHEFEKQKAVVDALLNAARTGQLSSGRIDESVYRILNLKKKYSLSDETVDGPVDSAGINDEIRALLNK